MTIQETITRLRELMKKATNGPWVYRDGPQSILAWNDQMHIADIRGYGYLAGGLKLRQQEAMEIMDANGELLAAAVNALPALLEAAEQSQWRPIETAPKDGTYVLLWWPYWSNDPMIGFWCLDAWYGERAVSGEGDGPTHWMPLLEGPEA